jgi:transposase InsO family protein
MMVCEHASRWAAVVSISTKIGCMPQTLHEWVKNAEIDSGRRTVAGSCITATESAQYLSIKYTKRLSEAGIESSVGSVGDSYDNALAETIKRMSRSLLK